MVLEVIGRPPVGAVYTGLELVEVVLELGEIPLARHVPVVKAMVDNCDLTGGGCESLCQCQCDVVELLA